MKKPFFTLLAASLSVMVLASCTSLPNSAESSVQSQVEGSSAASFQSESSSMGDSSAGSLTESSAAETALAPVRTLEGDYEVMLPAGQVTGITPPLSHGDTPYYTVQKDGKWGLLDENGTELLPCTAEEAVSLCFLEHWTWWGDADDWDALSASVQKATGYPLCGGHGGSSRYFFAIAPGEPPEAIHGQPGSSGVQKIEPQDVLGDCFFPVQYGELAETETGPDLTGNVFWNFSDADGNVLCPNEEFEQAGWFGGEALAPVQRDGKWAYVDAEGNFATEFVYESCWGDDYILDPETGEYVYISPCSAFSPWNGFAPVLRGGKWGVIDETGKEVIPCACEAGAPYPGGAWLRSDGQWALYLLS